VTLHEAIEKGVLGKDIKARMMRTVPGRLADVIDRLLYSAQQSERGEVILPGKEFVGLGGEKDRVAGKPWPAYLGLSDDGNYADTLKALRAVFDHLEACAVQEVTAR
jgi:hypothetical protein